ncbi:MAG: S8 family serine peptidase [Rhodoferax sp.]|nr:S8 family serine peptidase [Rhodoferax sp.]
MKKNVWIGLSLALGAMGGTSLHAWTEDTSPPSTRLRYNAVGAGTQGAPSATASTDHLSNRIIVKMRNGAAGDLPAAGPVPQPGAAFEAGPERVQAMAVRSAPGQVRYLKTIYRNTHVVITRQPLPRQALESIARAMAADPDVAFAEVDEFVRPHAAFNDALWREGLWNLLPSTTNAGGANFLDAWGLTQGGSSVTGSGVTVAVLDSGYRPHQDLYTNLWTGYDFVSAATDRDGTPGWDANPADPGDWSDTDKVNCATSTWHGTHVAGIIAAVANNTIGMVGAAYGAKVLPVRVLGVCGGYSSDIQEGMYWAAGLHTVQGATNPHAAKVLNLSLGVGLGASCSAGYQAAVDAVINAGVTVVASTGNDGKDHMIASPANCKGVIAVTAHDRGGKLSEFANIGPGTTLSAPGTGIMSTSNTGQTSPVASPGGDNWQAESGTSMSAAHVAAAAALLYQINPAIQPATVRYWLTSQARPFSTDLLCSNNTDCGTGMVDAYAAAHAMQVRLGKPNAAPVLQSIPNQTVPSTASLQFTASATDTDADPISYIISTLPSGASFNNATGEFVWPRPQAGTYPLTLQASDGMAKSSSQTVTITVAPTPSSGGGGAVQWLELVVLGLMWLVARTLQGPPSAPHQPRPH